MYKAVATLQDKDHSWDVVIYSNYESLSDAIDGVRRFNSTSGQTQWLTILKVTIEKE